MWLAGESKKVSSTAKEVFADPDNDLFLSIVSCWEMSVKYVTAKLKLPEPPARLVPTYRERYGIASLPLDEEVALYLPRLPKLHADPFDRMLVCQSIIHGLVILTPDEAIAQYAVRTIW